ncbi:MAG: nicotinamide riboside transporter PnuC [Bacteroidales bacterium]
MKYKFEKINTLNLFDWFLIIGVVVANLIYSIKMEEFDWMGSIAGVTGVVCVVLVAKGNIFNYLFGVVNVTLYAIISYKAKLYGDAALNALYYFPMQFIGWYSWVYRRQESSGVTVTARRLSFKGRLFLTLFTVATVLLGAWLLKYWNDPQPLKDSATTVISIIAMYIMVKRYMEQWVLWVAVNLISVAMWVVAWIAGGEHAALMVIMWLFYLVNSISGWVNWSRLSQERY